MSGIEVIQQKASFQKYNADTPVLALTANTTPEDLDYYTEIGFASTLSKPYNAQSLVQEMHHVLSR